MTSVYVKPRKGGRVRMPDRNFRVMSERGDYVPRTDYYERLILAEDLIICDQPPADPVPAASTSPEPL
jgi:hypothetical protein